MLHKDSDHNWDKPTDEQKLAFEMLKTKLASPPIIALPKVNLPITIDRDTSNYSMGAILLKHQDEDNPTKWATFLILVQNINQGGA